MMCNISLKPVNCIVNLCTHVHPHARPHIHSLLSGGGDICRTIVIQDMLRVTTLPTSAQRSLAV